MKRESYFKELAREIVGPGKSEICRAGWQAGNPGRISVLQCYSLKAAFLLLGETSVFAFKAFSSLDETHPHDGV